jgi:hypothetical protein
MLTLEDPSRRTSDGTDPEAFSGEAIASETDDSDGHSSILARTRVITVADYGVTNSRGGFAREVNMVLGFQIPQDIPDHVWSACSHQASKNPNAP